MILMFDSDESYTGLPTVVASIPCVFSIGSIPGFFQWLLPLDSLDIIGPKIGGCHWDIFDIPWPLETTPGI